MTETLFCYNHPTRETSLRCNNCNRPICASCAVRTPTGYRCKDCVRERQKSFETSEWYDFLIGGVVAAFLSGIAAGLVTAVGGIGFFGWFLIAAGAPIAATVIAESVRAATRKRRSRALFITVAVGVVVGAAPVILFQLFIGNMFGIVYQIIYLVIAVPTVYARLAGIQLFR
jgi:MFS family permease